MNAVRMDTEISYKKPFDQMERSIDYFTEEVRSALNETYNLYIPSHYNGFLHRCLRVKDYQVDKAAKLVKNVIRSTQSLQDILHKFRPKFYEEVYMSGGVTLLRSRDSKGRQVLLSRVGQWDPKELDFDQTCSAQILLFSVAVGKSPETQRNGIVFIYDLSGFGIRHVKAMKPNRLLQFVSMMQSACPAKIKGVHLIFHPRVFGIIYQMVRPLLTDKLAKRVYFHGDSFSSLHQFVSADILPQSFGGYKPDKEAIDESFLKYLISEDNIHTEMRAYGIPSF